MATIQQAKTIIKASRHSGVPVMLWSAPGNAKSSVVKQVAKELGLDYFDIRASLTDAGDFLGLPIESKDKKTGEKEVKYLISSFLPKDPNWEGIIFLDELPCAPKEVMNALLQLVLDKQIMNHYTLPKGAFIVAAGNPSGFDNYVTELPGALRSRFLHINLAPTDEEWFDHANKSGYRRDVVRFAAEFPKYLTTETQDFELSTIKPNKRSFEMVSNILNGFESQSEMKAHAMIIACGLLGSQVGVQFAQFLDKDYNKIESKFIPFEYNKVRSTVLSFAEKGLVPEQKQALEELLAMDVFTEEKNYKKGLMKNVVTFLNDIPGDISYHGIRKLITDYPLFNTKFVEIYTKKPKGEPVEEVVKLYKNLMIMCGK